jgi:hypothetical protein
MCYWFEVNPNSTVPCDHVFDGKELKRLYLVSKSDSNEVITIDIASKIHFIPFNDLMSK